MTDRANAGLFFQQLEIFSQRYWKEEHGENLIVWHRDSSRVGFWRGAIIHYTADDDLDCVVRWFTRDESKVSAHVVVHDRRLGCHERLAHDLPLVQALPATVIQCVPTWERAWHATWANSLCYGIECVNAGELRHNANNELCTWHPKDAKSPEWTKPWASAYKSATTLFDRNWVRYELPQIAAVVHVLRHLWLLSDASVRPSRPWVLGHEHVQANKSDPGPDFPIHGVREASFDPWRPIQQYGWYYGHSDTWYGQTWRDRALRGAVAVIAGAGLVPTPHVAWERARAAWAAMPEHPYRDHNPAWAKLGLWLLGYYIESCQRWVWGDAHFGVVEKTTLEIFQRRSGLAVDGVWGPQTALALQRRLAEAFPG